MDVMDCHNGKCGLKNQTTNEILDFINPSNSQGFAFFLFEDKSFERGFRKDIIKNINYSKTLELAEYFGEPCVAFKFIPHGYDKELDTVVEKIKDGVFDKQLELLGL